MDICVQTELVRPWSESEIRRRKIVEAGGTVTCKLTWDVRLVEWATEWDLLVKITGGTDWDCPYRYDPWRDTDGLGGMYRSWLRQKRPDLVRRLPELRGKVLGCHCYPRRCHGDILIEELPGPDGGPTR